MLKRIFMMLFIPLPLFAAIAAGAFYLQYQQYVLGAKSFDRPQLSLLEYSKFKFDTYLKVKATHAAAREFDIRATLPAPAEGWARATYIPAHGEQITGDKYEPSLLSPYTEMAIQNKFRVVKPRAKDAVTASYIRGDEIISVWMKVVPAPDTSTLQGQVEKRLETILPSGEPDPVFMSVAGVDITSLPQISRHYIKNLERPANYRRFEGKIGEQLEVFAFTNADDAAVKQVLGGIDFAALKAFANIVDQNIPKEPVPTPEEKVADLKEADEAVVASVATLVKSPGFKTRLKEFFSSGSEEEEPRRKMVCTNRKGAKHCYFPEED